MSPSFEKSHQILNIINEKHPYVTEKCKIPKRQDKIFYKEQLVRPTALLPSVAADTIPHGRVSLK